MCELKELFSLLPTKRFQRSTADVFSASHAEMWQQMISVMPGAWFRREDGAYAMMTGIPVPALNCVCFERPNPSLAAVAALLDETSRGGVPYSMRIRSASDAAFDRLAKSRDMTPDAETTLMAVDASDIGGLARQEPAGLTIRRLAPDEAPRHALVASAAFGFAPDMFLRAVRPDLLRLPSVGCYVGEVAGRPVTTSLRVTIGACTGIFSVGTVPGFRGRGFGAAMTARAVADGLAAGSQWCWLEATEAGLPVYQKAGFQVVEPRRIWVSAPCVATAAGD